MMDGNGQIFDQTVRYQVFLERYKNGSLKRLREFLTELDIDLTATLERKLDAMTIAERANLASAGNATTDRLKDLKEFFAEVEIAAAAELESRVVEEVAPIGQMRAERVARIAAVTAEVTLAIPAVSRLERIVRTDPFQGKVLKEWASEWSEARQRRVLQALRLGLAQGEATSDIVKRLRGTKNRGYKNGILEVSKRSAETIVRTASNHVSAVADIEIARRNSSVIQAMVRTAVLDGRTSEVCRVNDGREYAVDDMTGVLPAHPNCRSFFTAKLVDQGTVPQDERYYDWLKRQPKDVQIEAIGPTRAKLIEEGGLDPAKLANMATGQEYTLEQLREREASAFDKAGI